MEMIPLFGILMPWLIFVGVEVVCAVLPAYGALRLVQSNDSGARMIGWLVFLGLAVVAYWTYSYIQPYL
jgi:hypothetical protein